MVSDTPSSAFVLSMICCALNPASAYWVVLMTSFLPASASAVGGGVARTFKLGDQLMSLSALYYTYVAQPITTPQTNLKVV
jgi:hypothetical protein